MFICLSKECSSVGIAMAIWLENAYIHSSPVVLLFLYADEYCLIY